MKFFQEYRSFKLVRYTGQSDDEYLECRREINRILSWHKDGKRSLGNKILYRTVSQFRIVLTETAPCALKYLIKINHRGKTFFARPMHHPLPEGD